MDTDTALLLRQLPCVNDCLAHCAQIPSMEEYPLGRLKHCIRLYLDALRKQILAGTLANEASLKRSQLFAGLERFAHTYNRQRFIRVINATGVIVHTNLGRSLLPASALKSLVEAASGYSNLELDLHSGRRGSRYSHVEELLCELTGAEAALVVNNNAAGVLIALETLGKGREVIVSRGQLVEIGGSFRIPDIMERSGARLIEVGTTNRTHARDYEGAMGEETALLLKVHCSNYRIIGFTKEVDAEDLVRIGRKAGVPVMEDLGSGCLLDLSRFGLAKEPTVQEVVACGMDIVTFSGDKLLGGPQAGIIVGGKKYIDQIKRNPINRALRIDKFTLSSLESVLRLYLNEDKAIESIPTLRMIAASESSVQARVARFCSRCRATLSAQCTVLPVSTFSQVGGGALPEQNLPSWAVSLDPKEEKLSRFEARLRAATVPVMGRVENNRLLLDLRTVGEQEEDDLFASIQEALLGLSAVEHAR
ncbi:L-seryl-tRNA(Sec) selenium transferase [uncultured Vibrio sp.]|uniref:L-seryl-tRNA(Sec) selenium transferase n=1 Tax=uncultured Vibrio sp. TaxID=114054 RepID=UPI002AA64D52|nr:L-seryl-tRNA(Sec) selenium transferase [uncultured Vibrio sp.]